ncbi:hypothetical protein HNP84_001890 [Thermocatellispora tengchongensis]|uniref:Uncharacterized protein n=1 Tax=Thermocatellispora tengchongensis TaxID=1073253 RepID=A0A840P4M1_9ACTN|nr:hypothetical protein [Thermocatellispora tengchongensis]
MARELKYTTHHIDLERLRAELATVNGQARSGEGDGSAEESGEG